MDDIYGPIPKARTSILLFLVPAVLIVLVSVGLMYDDKGSLNEAISNPVTVLSVILAVIATVWGMIFLSRPVVTLTPDEVVLSSGRRLKWTDITEVKAGKSTTRVASTSGAHRNVVHEVVRLFHTTDEPVEVVTTWALIGPQAANDRIVAAFDRSKLSRADT